MKRFLCVMVAMALLATVPVQTFSAVEDGMTVGLFANDIDYENCREALEAASEQYSISFVRTTDPSAFSRVVVLGGHEAPTDGNMPFNLAEQVLPQRKKDEIITGAPILYSITIRLDGNEKATAVTVIAGAGRELTAQKAQRDADGDRLTNIVEALSGTRYDSYDTDGDDMNDGFELLFSEENGGLYDPRVYNGRYFLYVEDDANQNSTYRTNFENYLFDLQKFSENNYTFMYKPCVAEFENKIIDLSKKVTENDFVYIWTHTHGNDGRIALNHELIYVDDLEDLIDKIDNSKATVYQMDSCSDDYNVSLFDSDSDKIVSSGEIFTAFRIIDGDRIPLKEIDKDKNGYVDIAEYIQFAIEKPFGDYAIYDPNNLASKIYHGSYSFETGES